MELNHFNNNQTISSREIAELSGKQHGHILESIRKQEVAWQKVNGSKFRLSEYIDSTGRKLPEYQLTKKESLYIGTKFNDESRVKLVNRWEELEIKQQQPLSTLDYLSAQLQLMQEQEKRLNTVETKVDYLITSKEQAEKNLKELPFEISVGTAPELGLRDKIRMLVNRYAKATETQSSDVWNNIYQTLYYNYHISIKSYKKERKNESYLEVAERNLLLDKIFNIASNLVNSNS